MTSRRSLFTLLGVVLMMMLLAITGASNQNSKNNRNNKNSKNNRNNKNNDDHDDHIKKIISTVRECYNRSAIKREGQRSSTPRYSHNKGDSLVKMFDAIDDIDIAQMVTLSDCIKIADPTRFEDRKFDQNANKYGGGNDVIYLTGLMPLITPSLSRYLLEVASAAAEEAGWRPHISHLGIRCIEKLQYHPGGELLYHTDHGSVYTLVLVFSDETEYIGGEFQIKNADRSIINHKAPRFGGMLFDSIKDHGITTIKEGERHVLVIEFWPYEDTNVKDRRPHEVRHNFQAKLPKLLEVSTEHYCPSKVDT